MGHDLRPENWTIYDQSIRNSCVMTLCNDYFAWPGRNRDFVSRRLQDVAGIRSFRSTI